MDDTLWFELICPGKKMLLLCGGGQAMRLSFHCWIAHMIYSLDQSIEYSRTWGLFGDTGSYIQVSQTLKQ